MKPVWEPYSLNVSGNDLWLTLAILAIIAVFVMFSLIALEERISGSDDSDGGETSSEMKIASLFFLPWLLLIVAIIRATLWSFNITAYGLLHLFSKAF